MTKISINFNIWCPAVLVKIAVWFLLRWRRRQYGYDFRRIKLLKGKYTIVDVENYEELNKYNWFIKPGGTDTFYAVRKQGGIIVYMHRQVVPVPKGLYVDHINRDGLDNRKANLRPATHSENCRNRGKMRGNYTSKYKGVHRDKGKGKWRANVRVDKKLTHLGYFSNEIEAAKVYDAAAKLYHGKYAALNFPDETPINTDNSINILKNAALFSGKAKPFGKNPDR